MPLLTRSGSAVGAGTIAALLLVLIFGSPWFRDWAAGHTDPSLLDALGTAGMGATYGLFAGWIVGLAALAGR